MSKLPPVTSDILKQYKEFFTVGKRVLCYIFDEQNTWIPGEIKEWKDKSIILSLNPYNGHSSPIGYNPELPIEYLDIYVKGI